MACDCGLCQLIANVLLLQGRGSHVSQVSNQLMRAYKLIVINSQIPIIITIRTTKI